MSKGESIYMKNLWIDILLAFLIFQLSTYLYNHTSSEFILNQEVEMFNEDIKNQEIVDNYHIPRETNPNAISNFVEEMSEISRFTIKVAVEILGGFN